MEKLQMRVTSAQEDNIASIANLFPNCISEVVDQNGNTIKAIDFTKLKQELSCSLIDEGKQRYEFTWPDKNTAITNANSPTYNTLRPCIEDSVDFEHTKNLYIEGDNLEVLKCLREAYLNKVKVIYIDPPYNTGSDLIYEDNFTQGTNDFLAISGQTSSNGERLVSNLQANGRFHTDWLNMIYPRLKIARQLLCDEGVIFISIDDNEDTNLQKVCEELFGESNFVAKFIWKRKQGGGHDSGHVVLEHEYVLCFAKQKSNLKLNLDKFYPIDKSAYPYHDQNGDYNLITLDKSSIRFSQSLVFDIIGPDGKVYRPRIIKGKQSCWRWNQDKVHQDYESLVFKDGNVYTKNYYPEDGIVPRSLLVDELYGRTRGGTTEIQKLFGAKVFTYPKPVALIKHLIALGCSDGIVLDFFSGSATCAHAVMELNAEDGGHRQFIMVQIPEESDEIAIKCDKTLTNLCEIGKERIRLVRNNLLKSLEDNQSHLRKTATSDNHKTGIDFIPIGGGDSKISARSWI